MEISEVLLGHAGTPNLDCCADPQLSAAALARDERIAADALLGEAVDEPKLAGKEK